MQGNHEHINVGHRTYCTSAPFAISTVTPTCCRMHYWLKTAGIRKQVRFRFEPVWSGEYGNFLSDLPWKSQQVSHDYAIWENVLFFARIWCEVLSCDLHIPIIHSRKELPLWTNNIESHLAGKSIPWLLYDNLAAKELRMGKQGSGTYIRNVISCQDQAAVVFGLTRTLLLLWIWRTC